MKNIRQVISGGLDSAPSPCFSSLIPDNVPAVQFRNAEYKPGWKMCVYIYVRYVLTGREREQGSKEVWRKKEGLWEIFRFPREIDRERGDLPRSNC